MITVYTVTEWLEELWLEESFGNDKEIIFPLLWATQPHTDCVVQLVIEGKKPLH